MGCRVDRRWLPLNALRAFEAVAKRESFTAGAQALNVTQSALSRHVIALEELLGCKLLERRPQGVVLTEAGATLLPAVTRSFDRIEQVLADIRSDGGAGTRRLRVHMPPTFLSQVAIPALREFRREFPDIVVDITSSCVTGLPAGDLDLAVTYDRPRADDTGRDLLWMVRVTPVCAPELAEAHRGLPLAEFLERNELLHVRIEGEARDHVWAGFAGRCGIAVETDRGLSFDTAALAAQYAASGAGVAVADVDMFAQDIRSGRLVAPYDVTCEDGYGYFMAVHPDCAAEPATAVFRSWMLARFARPPGERPWTEVQGRTRLYAV